MTRQCGCGRPTELYGCPKCVDHLAETLGDVPALAVELDTTLTRQARMTAHSGRSRETPLVFHQGASEARTVLSVVLVSWAVLVAKHLGAVLDLEPKPVTRTWTGRAVTPTPAPDRTTLAARWLLAHLKDLARMYQWGEIHRQVTDAVRDARRAIDRPADRVYAGPCDGNGTIHVELVADPCGLDLLADPDWATIRCHTCSNEYDIQLRRDWMLEAVRGYVGYGKDVSRICRMLGLKITEPLIRKWRQRGKLHPRQWSEDDIPRPLYAVDDVITIAAGGTVDYEEAS